MAANSARTAKRRGLGKPFAPGVSGNPSGRPRVIGELRDLARQHTRKAIQTLVNVMEAGELNSARVAAAIALLDRGYGKPRTDQPVPTGLEAELRALTDEELELRIGELLGVTGVKTRQESIYCSCSYGGDSIETPPIEKLTLTRAATIIWYGPTSPELYEQANGRISRPGQTKMQTIIHIMATALERAIYVRLKEKLGAQGVLLGMLRETGRQALVP